jgi:hypothetical protein
MDYKDWGCKLCRLPETLIRECQRCCRKAGLQNTLQRTTARTIHTATFRRDQCTPGGFLPYTFGMFLCRLVLSRCLDHSNARLRIDNQFPL